MNLIRADKWLTDSGRCESRNQAAEWIREGYVWIGGKRIEKPSTLVPRNSTATILRDTPAFVSRGGQKLAHALDTFTVTCSGCIALDCGASTGGFTDCLLKRGAVRVYAVDVGYGQLHWSLRNDSRVMVHERTNFRTAPIDLFPEPFDLITLDMSFISLKLVLEKARDLLTSAGAVIALIKPQFEAGKENVGSGGVVRDARIHREVLRDLGQWSIHHGFSIHGITTSPIRGPKGNKEFLFHLTRGSDRFSAEHDAWIEQAVLDE
ncbi:TlyA family RNA methyltransferase [bacterium]|nr:TlyA family RNA methyltransferase [candidate division CSSED10-310 bacterium]